MSDFSKQNINNNTDGDNEITIKCEEPDEYPPVFCKIELESNELTCGNEERHQSDPIIEEGKNNTNMIKEEKEVKGNFHQVYIVSCETTLKQLENTNTNALKYPNLTAILNTPKEPPNSEHGTFSRVYGENTSNIITKENGSSNQGSDVLSIRKNGKNQGKKVQKKNTQKSQGKNTHKTWKKNSHKSKVKKIKKKRKAAIRIEKPLRKLVIEKEIKFYYCSHCYKCFTSHVRYMNHLITHGITKEEYRKLTWSPRIKKPVKLSVCQKCGKSFTSNGSLRDHMALHEGVKNYKCNVCYKLFLTQRYLKLHSLCHIQSINYICNECGKCYLIKRSLKEHLKTHNDRPKGNYVCEVCNKYYSYRSDLKEHMRNAHDNTKLYVCHICGNILTTPRCLRRHLLIHKDIRNYICEICNKQFSRKDNLRVHIASHEKLTHKRKHGKILLKATKLK